MIFKKVVASTLSAGLVLSFSAALPLSTKGLLAQVEWVHTANAAIDLSGIASKINDVKANLTETEKAPIQEAITKLQNLSDVSLVSDITGKVTSVSDEELLSLFAKLGFFINANEAALTAALSDTTIHGILNNLAVEARLDLNVLSVNDAVQFVLALEAKLVNQVKNKDITDLGLLALSDTLMKAEIKTAIQSVMNDTATYKLSLALSNLGITADEVASLTNKITLAVDPDRKAIFTLALAYIRPDIALTLTSGNLTNSRTVEYSLTAMNRPVPNLAVKWSSSNSGITATEGASNMVTLSMPTGTSATTTLTATIDVPGTPINNVVLTSQTITMNAAEENTGGTGNTGGTTTTTGPVTPPVNDTKALADQIKTAPPEQKAALIAELKQAIDTAVAQMSNIDISASVKVEGDKAKSNLDVAGVVNQINQIIEEIKKLNDQLKAADPTAAPVKSTLTFDMGNQSAKTTEFTLPKAILDAAKGGGVSDISIRSNGVGIKVKSTMFSSDTTVSMTKQEDSVANPASNQRLVSNVVDIEFTSSNQRVTNFSDPVELSLPVTNLTGGIDTEKLVVGKIVDGRIQPVGGKYNATDKRVATNRNSFSTYTVIENNVTFSDIASVQAWAGRQIEVAAAKGIVEGRAAGAFVPEGTITRAEFAKLIVTTFGIEDVSAKESFNDVNDDDWFKPYVASAVKAGLVNGREEGKFDPNGWITRAEMATIASRALRNVNGVSDIANADAALKSFSDAAQIPASLKASVALAVNQGIIIGDEGDKLNPNGVSTRAQAAVVIYRLLNK